MNFEVHITAPASIPIPVSASDGFKKLCEAVHGKPLHIVLSKGLNKEQLMCGFKGKAEDDLQALAKAYALKETLAVSSGLYFNRVKVETPIIPGDAMYYEAHWKFNDISLSGISKIREFKEELKYSWNKYAPSVGYLTARFYSPSSTEAIGYFNEFDCQIKKTFTSFQKVHYERVIFDSNFGLDEGW